MIRLFRKKYLNNFDKKNLKTFKLKMVKDVNGTFLHRRFLKIF